MPTSWTTWCPCTDTKCPKTSRQLGTWPSREDAEAALVHHLENSSYHYMTNDDAINATSSARFKASESREAETGAAGDDAREAQRFPPEPPTAATAEVWNAVEHAINSLRKPPRSPVPPQRSPRRRSRSHRRRHRSPQPSQPSKSSASSARNRSPQPPQPSQSPASSGQLALPGAPDEEDPTSRSNLMMIRDSLTRASTSLRAASRMASNAALAFSSEADAVASATADIDSILVRRR